VRTDVMVPLVAWHAACGSAKCTQHAAATEELEALAKAARSQIGGFDDNMTFTRGRTIRAKT